MERITPFKLHIARTGRMLVDATIFASDKLLLEEGAVRQLCDATELPGIRSAMGMPDMHFGYGVPIGSVIALDRDIVPAAVGYDINCGMRRLTTPLEAADADVKLLAQSVSRDIPLGEGKSNVRVSKEQLDIILAEGIRGFHRFSVDDARLESARDEAEETDDIARVENNGSLDGDPSAISHRAKERGGPQLGTLGGGNHFIEIQEVDAIYDEQTAKAFGLHEGQLVVMIHSGSRGLGHETAGDYMKLAERTTLADSPNRHLCFLPIDSPEGQNYVGAMNAAANYAFVNRQVMASFVRRNFRHYLGDIPMPTVYDVTHNMAKLEEHGGRQLWVHRKGATRAFPAQRMHGTPYAETGQPVIIPGSMGTASYVLVGRPDATESLFSVNHGAGRVMSRTKAAGKISRKGKVVKPAAISDERFSDSMEGIHLICANRRQIKEEAPDAYKDIDEVINTVTGAGLADKVARLVPLAVLKG